LRKCDQDVKRNSLFFFLFIFSFLKMQEKEDGPLYKFYEVIMDTGGEFMQGINNLRDVTLLAPSNEAWNNPNLKNIIR
jgi:fasciclin 1